MTLLAMPVVVARSELLPSHLQRSSRTLRALERGDIRMLQAARVATRRIRELVPILQLESTTTRKLSRRLRKMTKHLGGVRELDVLLLLIDELHEIGRAHV